MRSADHKKMMKAFRRLSAEEQARLEEMLQPRGKKKSDDEPDWEQFESDLRRWNRLCRTGRC